jgi:hypothetical protein
MPPNSTCATCGEMVTMMREVSLVRNIWELLKPLEPNADTINVERHLPNQFQQSAPRADSGTFFNSSYSVLTAGHRPPNVEIASPRHASPGRNRLTPHPLLSPVSPGYRQMSDTSKVEPSEAAFSKESNSIEPQRSNSETSRPFSPGTVGSPGSNHTRFEHSVSTVSFEPVPPSRSRTVPLVQPPDKGKSKWRSKFGSRKESAGASASIDNSSLSSSTLEGQRLEEISLKELTIVSKKNSKGKTSKCINVALSQNSSYALFWTQSSIYIWDIGMSPPILGRAIATDSTCVLAAVSKVHLAYIIGTRDQKLTLRIVNLIQPNVNAVEYRMPSSLWCRTIAISDSHVVIGFDNSVVRFFSTKSAEDSREDRLHSRYHTECKECQPIETLSFSHDGLVLLASTRSPKSGMIQVYSWRYPFTTFEEISACRYQVPLHESEDGGISSAIYRSGSGGDENLVCLTSWTQSGIPILVQPRDGHRTDIRTEISNRQSRLGNRIQTACFSPSGKELAIVNDKGDLYKIGNLNSTPLDIKKFATSKELTAKSESFAMSFMSLPDEESIVMAWVDTAKCVGYIKKIPITVVCAKYMRHMLLDVLLTCFRSTEHTHLKQRTPL